MMIEVFSTLEEIRPLQNHGTCWLEAFLFAPGHGSRAGGGIMAQQAARSYMYSEFVTRPDGSWE